jgi:hypothetical protein
VGDHIRPRASVPESWKWPVGVSLSAEVGYQRSQYSQDTWTLELRPIIDKQIGRWYLSFNPTVDRAFHGPGVTQGVVFSPNFKAGYDFTKKVNMGIGVGVTHSTDHLLVKFIVGRRFDFARKSKTAKP